MNSHREPKICVTCGLTTSDYYVVARGVECRECHEVNQRRAQRSDTGRATSPIRSNGKDAG